jgi:UDP-2,4-diacetamido-2,4,6-trideoxy-beta-L-altropyranose hydrolase
LKPYVFIRADGSQEIGLGHLVRCMALAHMLKKYFNITFFCSNIPDALQHEILVNRFGLKLIQKETDFLNLINSETIIVLDGYQFDTNYQKQIKANGAKLVCIDDLHDKEFVADLIINHTPGIKPSDYKAQAYTQFALGLGYALLRPAFLEQIRKKRIIEKIETVLICFGGSDPINLTKRTLEVVTKYNQFKKIIVVTGESFKFTESIESIAKKEVRISHRNNLSEQEMLNTMLDAELAVTPSSTILLELFTVGMSAISGYYVENQREASVFFRNQKLVLDVGNMNHDYQEKLSKQINEVFIIDYDKMIIKQKEIMKQTNLNLTKIFHKIYNKN